MPRLLTSVLALSTLGLIGSACTAPDNLPEPPVLKVTSPQRSLQQAGAGQVKVTGTVEPNIDGTPVEKVLVNNVQATLEADGSFHALIDIPAGATLIHTIARDTAGTEASDTRAVHAGELRTAGANIDRALAAAISTEAFAKISAAAGPLIEGMDIGAMIKPLQPMIRSGDPADLNSEDDCLFVRGYIDDVDFTNIELSLVPKQGGIAFSAQIDGLNVPGHARFAAGPPFVCPKFTQSFRVAATKVVVAGTLLVKPNGTAGFKTDLQSPQVTLTGLDISASGIPGEILDLLDLDTRIQGIIALGAQLAMEPLMNQALGALAGPKQLDVLGKTVNMEMAPATIAFDPTGGVVELGMKMLIGGAESAKFIYTPNGRPTLEPGTGFQIGLADDLANELLAEATAVGLLNLSLPKAAGTFDTIALSMTLPPMVNADPADGSMKVILGDTVATFTNKGKPVGKAAINATIGLKINPAANGYGVGLELGEPVLHVTTLDDIANDTRFSDADLARTIEAGLRGQIESISKLLVSIPLPQVAGLQMRNLSVGSDAGYVMVKGAFE
ncbi:MAG TPA: hypothetical protein VNO30_21865 [Kofleriaceae bacterium]|nr:hypothetical protein [Kofleriaceae bacterium]